MIEYKTHCGMVSKYNFILVKAISRDNRLKAVEKSGYHVTSGEFPPLSISTVYRNLTFKWLVKI